MYVTKLRCHHQVPELLLLLKCLISVLHEREINSLQWKP
uniref:Uncharacterized protein n=1 Tax=Anguilla anguilla TaxID=7936 RepID=A0A0E9T9R7_ANGAN